MDPDPTNILVVDDLPEKLLVYRSILDDLGQTLVTAQSGEEALALVLRQEFAVILLDVNMPGMSGLEAAALIRRRRRSAHTPIIFLTAFADEIRVAEGYAHGAVDYILTPVVPDILRAKVRVFVDLYRMTQQVRRQAEERVALAEERSKRAAAEDATRRSEFLADVSRALADSLDPDTTARTLARQAVPFLADLAGVTLVGDPGQPWRTELAWADPEPRHLALGAADAPKDGLRAAVDRALAGGRPELLPDLDVPYPEAAGVGPSDARGRSAVVVPLRARGRTLGALALTFGPSGRRHGPADVALAEDLGGRAGIALDNARLYRDVERADRQKNEFLSMLAHELRNPLAPIRNAAEMIRLCAPDVPRLQMARQVIDRQLAHLVRLVDDLLDVSRITKGKVRLQIGPADLAAVVHQAVEAARPVIEAAGHRFHLSLPPHPVTLRGDHVRLAQVFGNLLTNAAKYTEPGGEVRLAAEATAAEVTVVVADTGVGIPADMLGSVFELFTQVDRSLDRSQGGLGIGLTLVKRLVELHGGTVTAASGGPGRGSTFTVRLPVAGPAGDPEAEQRAAVPPGSGLQLSRPGRTRVLVVDDNRDGAETLATLLGLAGYEVRVEHDGPAALEAVGRFRPAAVVLDIGLPGLDGYEVARRLRQHPAGRAAVLVAVTGYGREEDRRQAAAAGFDAHLTKPVELEQLRRALNAAR